MENGVRAEYSAPKVFIFAYADEKEQIAQLAQYLNEQGAELQPLGDNNLESVLAIVKGLGTLLSKTNEETYSEYFNSILSVVIGFAPEDAIGVIKAWRDVVLAAEYKAVGWNSRASAIVQVFSNLFQFYDTSADIKFYTFLTVLEMAGRAKVTRSIDITPRTIEGYFADWALTVEQQKQFLRVLHAALLADDRAKDAAVVMIRLLQAYTGADAANAAADAKECVRTAIIDPHAFSFDHLLRINAIKHLEKSDAKIFELLNIFNQGSLVDFKAFLAKNPNFSKEELKVDEQILIRKIKILTLISLAEKSRKLPYDQLLKVLEVADNDELESFLIDVLQSKVISGKLNGVAKEFHVTAFQQRHFDLPEWKNLRTRLQNVLSALKASQTNLEIASHPELIESRLHFR